MSCKTTTFLRIFACLIVGAGVLGVASRDDEEAVTYVSLGDSLAVGVGASEPSRTGYAPRFENYLEDRNGTSVDLVQLGLSGETSGGFIGAGSARESQLERASGVLRDQPDSVVTISIGANDLLAVGDDTDAGREDALEEYRSNLDDILVALERASGGEAEVIILDLYNPVEGELSDTWVDALNADIREVSARHGATVAEVNAAFESREMSYTNLPEDFHPNDRGYRAIAEALEEA